MNYTVKAGCNIGSVFGHWLSLERAKRERGDSSCKHSLQAIFCSQVDNNLTTLKLYISITVDLPIRMLPNLFNFNITFRVPTYLVFGYYLRFQVSTKKDINLHSVDINFVSKVSNVKQFDFANIKNFSFRLFSKCFPFLRTNYKRYL